MKNVCWISFMFTLGLLALFVGTASAELVIEQNYQLISSLRVGRTAYDYTYQVNITNNGSDVQNVLATVSSNSPNTLIIDSDVSFGDVAEGETVTGADTFIIRQNRLYAFDPTSLSWDIQFTEPPITSIGIDAGLSVINIPVGTSKNVAFAINFESNISNTYNINFTQGISPDTNGISLSVDFTPSWTTNTSKTWVVNETINGNTIGTYELTSFAQITETGQITEVPITVNVISTEDLPVFKPLSSSPDAINTSVETEIRFTIQLSGSSVPPVQVSLYKTDELGSQIGLLGELNDLGASGDLLGGDNVYSGSFMVASDEIGGVFYQANALFPEGISDIYSNIYKLSVTDFPTEIVASDMSKIVIDPESGDEIISNEILVSFEDGTEPDVIKLIIDSISGTIIGTTAGVETFQVIIPDIGDANGVNTAIEDLLDNSEVLSAEPVNIAKTGAVTPNDTDYLSEQWGLRKIRADEAWVVSRGSALIAVLDTGVNYGHTDLNSKVIKGKDYVNDDSDPNDDHGHGTHVAGIAAAETNNSTGVAGVSWNSKILAVKVCDSAGGCSKSNVADGIRYAADNGAKIINMSLRFTLDIAFKLIPWPLPPYVMLWPTDSKLKKAVEYAASKGCLIVAAAGNDKCSKKTYPASYAEVFAVGATDSSDGIAVWNSTASECTSNAGSNFGDWVNIAAPGDAIYSTLRSGGYGDESGTSMASPMVAGAAAVVWEKFPYWSAVQVKERLEQTAKPLPGLELGAGRIDLFEAVFNGSFEIGDLSGWSKTGTASSLTSLGPIIPQDKNGHKKRFGYVSTGPAADYVSSQLTQTFNIQSGITSLPVSFDYNFLTEEYPEFVGSIYNDTVKITMKTPSGNTQILATESVNGSTFSLVRGIDFPGGDNTVGMTGWKSTTVNVPVTEGAGTYQIFIEDAGDDIYDSVILLDNVRFK